MSLAIVTETLEDQQLAERLALIVGSEHVLLDADMRAGYERDWTGRFVGRAAMVVRPADTAQLAATLRLCNEFGRAVVPQGGNTGLVGASVPTEGEVVLSCLRMNEIGPVDIASSQVTLGAGVTLRALQDHVRLLGFDFGVDIAARDSATIGGIAATNAGGERVLRYGMARASLAGLEVVLADGTVLSRLTGLPKDNVGYDVISLFVGSEGTLGVISRVRVKLAALLAHRVTALLALDSLGDAVDALVLLRSRLPHLECAEVMFEAGIELVAEQLGLRRVLQTASAVSLLVECAAQQDPTDDFAAALAELPMVRDSAVAQDARSREALWAARERHTEAINRSGIPLKLDIAVPLTSLAELVDEVHQVIQSLAPQARLILFGHLNEGNLHVNILGAPDQAEELTTAVLHAVARRGGSISAEHGVGRAKVNWISLCRSPEEIAAYRSLKNLFDPSGILNPGVILPTERREPL